MKRFVAGILGAALLMTSARARAQESEDVQEAKKAHERALCAERLVPLEKAIESDGDYANGWRDAWLLTGASLVVLNLTDAFAVSQKYRRTEDIVIAVQSTLLMIQKPTAVTNNRAVEGIRGSATTDPCLALIDAKSLFEVNEDDYQLHTPFINHVIGIAIPIISSALVAAATGHWDFIGNGNEGLKAAVGIVIGEAQLFTYPRPSVRVSGTALTLSF